MSNHYFYYIARFFDAIFWVQLLRVYKREIIKLKTQFLLSGKICNFQHLSNFLIVYQYFTILAIQPL